MGQLWEMKKDKIVQVYGECSWRRWRVFLAWSVRISRRGGSTVHFITSTKSGNEAGRINAQNRLAPGSFQLPKWTAHGPGGGPPVSEADSLTVPKPCGPPRCAAQSRFA